MTGCERALDSLGMIFHICVDVGRHKRERRPAMEVLLIPLVLAGYYTIGMFLSGITGRH